MRTSPIEILYHVQDAFSFDSLHKTFTFFGISLGDKIARATELFGQPWKKVKNKGKTTHTFVLMDKRTPYEAITVEMHTKENIIFSIVYEFRVEGNIRSIQQGLKNYKGTVQRGQGHPDNDAFLFRGENGVTFISSAFFSEERDGIFQTYILQRDDCVNSFKESDFGPSSLAEYFTASFPKEFYRTAFD